MKFKSIFANKNIAVGAMIATLLLFGLFILSIQRASPGPEDQEILGVGIGQWESEAGIVFTSGRQLNCQNLPASEAYNQRCTLMINNQPLEILASRNPETSMQQLSGQCTAVYAGETLNCQFGSRHVHVHWFAYVDQPSQLDKADMESLRTRFFLQNRSEEFFFRISATLAALTAVITLWNGIVWLRPYTRTRAVAFLGAIVPATVFFFISFIGTIFLTGSFWD